LKKTPPWNVASNPFTSVSPPVEDTLAILRGLKERYEVHLAGASRIRVVAAATRLPHIN